MALINSLTDQHSSNSPGYLVETQTDDGLRLKGFWQPVGLAEPAERMLWIIVHGVAGNFYDSSLLSVVASGIVAIENDVLRVNTRGHDPVAYIPTCSSASRVGAAYEVIRDAIMDLNAWLNFARKNGYRNIGLIGHSLGAVKVGLFTAQDTHDSIKGLICLSPPYLNATALGNDVHYGSLHQTYVAEARQHIQEGAPERLMTVRFPQPMLVAAATYLDKYGGDHYDYFQFAPRILPRTLWTFGELETQSERASFRECDLKLSSLMKLRDNHRIATIANADHNYSLSRPELVSMLQKWIDGPT